MVKMKLIGVEKGDFNDRDTKELKQCFIVNAVGTPENDRLRGEKAYLFYVMKDLQPDCYELCKTVPLGVEIVAYYSRRGKLNSFDVVEGNK